MKPTTFSIAAEFEDADLGDARRVDRLVKLAEAIAILPNESFPKIAGAEEVASCKTLLCEHTGYLETPEICGGPAREYLGQRRSCL
jgi:hypothetical protein